MSSCHLVISLSLSLALWLSHKDAPCFTICSHLLKQNYLCVRQPKWLLHILDHVPEGHRMHVAGSFVPVSILQTAFDVQKHTQTHYGFKLALQFIMSLWMLSNGTSASSHPRIFGHNTLNCAIYQTDAQAFTHTHIHTHTLSHMCLYT